jgi:ankyrin repeat protein
MGQAQVPPRPVPRPALHLPKPHTRTTSDRQASYYPASSEAQQGLPLRHRNPLTDAASTGDFESLMSMLLMRDFDVNALSEAGETALHIATRRQDADMIEALLARGAAPNALDSNGFTPLHHVVCNGESVTPGLTGRPVGKSTEIIGMLVSYGADVNATSFDGVSVIHEALRNKRTVEVTFLLSKGVHFESVSVSGDTPLHEACRLNDLFLADAIVKSKLYSLVVPKCSTANLVPGCSIPSKFTLSESVPIKSLENIWISNPVPVFDYISLWRRTPAARRAAAGLQAAPLAACATTTLYLLYYDAVASADQELRKKEALIESLEQKNRSTKSSKLIAALSQVRPLVIRPPPNASSLLPFYVSPAKRSSAPRWPASPAGLEKAKKVLLAVFDLRSTETSPGDSDEDDETEGTVEAGEPISVSRSEGQPQAPRHVLPDYGQLGKQSRANPLDLVGRDGKTPLGCCSGWVDDRKLIMTLLAARASFLLDDEILL